jgi:hypothetical protein
MKFNLFFVLLFTFATIALTHPTAENELMKRQTCCDSDSDCGKIGHCNFDTGRCGKRGECQW